MAKIDKIKEDLTTLRVFLTITIALSVTVGGSLFASYRQDLFDVPFWIGFGSEIVCAYVIIIIINKIKSKTNEIEDL